MNIRKYSAWALQYEKSKYDIYAALGFRDGELTWGKPLRKGIEDRQVMALNLIKTVRLRVDGGVVEVDNPPEQGRVIAMELLPIAPDSMVQIPFVDLEAAIEWTIYLQKKLAQ
jgi:hypothetical protein